VRRCDQLIVADHALVLNAASKPALNSELYVVQWSLALLLLRPRKGCEVLWWVRLCVCVCVFDCEDISGTHARSVANFCACCLWPWLGPPPASLWYVMYFRFCGWHVFFYNGPYSGMNFATKDRFHLNLLNLAYCKVWHNSISYYWRA